MSASIDPAAKPRPAPIKPVLQDRAPAEPSASIRGPLIGAPLMTPAELDAAGRAAAREELRTITARIERPASVQTDITLVRADGVTPEPIAWLWPGWLARGKVHVMAGAPGTGKTTLALAMGATLTNRGRWPDRTRAPIGDVLIWSGEDTITDTLVPRLIASGADLRRVHFVASFTDERGPRPFDPATDTEALSSHLATISPAPALLIVDPLVSAIAGDSHKNAEVRRALQPLVELASLRGVAVLGISHFSKGTQGRDPTERVTGSLAFGALARVVLAAARLPDEQGGGRILVRAKSNLGIDSGGFGYDLRPFTLADYPEITTTAVHWGEALTGSARDLLSLADTQTDQAEQTALDDAKGFLLAMLADGPVSAKRIKREADEAGHSDRTIRRAKTALGVEARKETMKGPWTWVLPAHEPKAAKEREASQP